MVTRPKEVSSFANMQLYVVAAAAVAAVAWLLRIVFVLRRRHSAQPSGAPPVRTMVVLGSGGHTAEMLTLLQGLDFRTYGPREYVLATTDHTSAQRVQTFENARQAAGSAHLPYEFLRVPRSREVGQSYTSSVFSTLFAMLHAFVLVFRRQPSLLLCNGPGTCIPVCAAAVVLRMLGVKYVSIVYVESICRVQSISLSGKILLHVADHFLVQWPQLVRKYPKARYIGRVS